MLGLVSFFLFFKFIFGHAGSRIFFKIYFWPRWVSVAVCGLSLAAALRDLECGLSSCGTWAQLLWGLWGPPGPRIEPTSPSLAGEFSTTGPPGKSPCALLCLDSYDICLSPSDLLVFRFKITFHLLTVLVSFLQYLFFSCWVMSDSSWLHGLQHARLLSALHYLP